MYSSYEWSRLRLVGFGNNLTRVNENQNSQPTSIAIEIVLGHRYLDSSLASEKGNLFVYKLEIKQKPEIKTTTCTR